MWENKLTDEIANYFLDGFKRMHFKVVYKGDDNGVIVNQQGWAEILATGAKRIDIRIESGFVTEIVFDEEMCFSKKIGCFSSNLKLIKEQFIGKPFDLPTVLK